MNSEEVVNFGAAFQVRRKELNLSLKEVENATSIRTQYLAAIEEGDFQKLISPVYAQGFVKQYASFLGLDGEQILTEHAAIFRQPIEQNFAYGIGTLEMRGNPGSSVKWVPNALWIGAFALVLFFAYFLARFLEIL